MKKEQQSIEDHTKNLLQKSLLKPISEDFNDQLMQKILQAPAYPEVKVKNNYSRKAWIFLVIALLCLLVSSLLIGKFSGGYFKDLTPLLSITFDFILYSGLVLFIPLILYHLDRLIQTSFMKESKNLSYHL